MAISFADVEGNLFNRLGRLGKVIDELITYQAAQYTNLIDETNGIVPQFDSEPDIQAIVGGQYIGQLNAPGGVGGMLQSVAIATVSRMVFRDNPLYNLTLTQDATVESIYEIIRQMNVEGATVLALTVTATPLPFAGFPTVPANTGNGTVVTSVRRPLDGAVLQNSFTENVRVTCSSDSYSGGAVAGNEGFTITGVGSQDNFFAFNWPLGSNGQAGFNAIDGAANQTSGNYLYNSGWDDWTNNAPDNWEITVGTAGTDVVEETGNVFGSGSAIKLVGDGSTLITFRQQFDNSDGTTSTLDNLTQFAANVYARRDGTAPSQGIISVELIDSGNNIILDQGGNACQYLIDLTTLTVFYAGFGGAFRTPEVMPDTYYIQFRMTVALENGRAVYLDVGALGNMVQLYTSGPYFAVFAGSIPFVFGDFTTCQVTNSFGAAGTQSTWQVVLNKLLNLQQQDILFPSSSSPTVSDALITRP